MQQAREFYNVASAPASIVVSDLVAIGQPLAFTHRQAGRFTRQLLEALASSVPRGGELFSDTANWIASMRRAVETLETNVVHRGHPTVTLTAPTPGVLQSGAARALECGPGTTGEGGRWAIPEREYPGQLANNVRLFARDGRSFVFAAADAADLCTELENVLYKGVNAGPLTGREVGAPRADLRKALDQAGHRRGVLAAERDQAAREVTTLKLELETAKAELATTKRERELWRVAGSGSYTSSLERELREVRSSLSTVTEERNSARSERNHAQARGDNAVREVCALREKLNQVCSVARV